MRILRRLTLVLTLAALAAACGSGGATETTLRDVAGDLDAEQVVELFQPVAATVREGDPGLYVGERRGLVQRVVDGAARPVLSVTEDVSTEGESGLLGLAFSPDGRHLYLSYTDTGGDSRLVEYAMDGDEPDPATRRIVLTVEQPGNIHNAGHLAFGPDGHLWLSLGDGGGATADDTSQRLDTLLGKLVRIDPRPRGDEPYGIPDDNPFVDAPGARPEIWAYGLRNPWRFSLDRRTGDLWIGDVGNARREEVDFEPAGSGGGRNYGWNRMEGTLPVPDRPPVDGEHAIPLVEYERGEARSTAVVGGIVYRGPAIPDLDGVYVFGDMSQGRVFLLRRLTDADPGAGDGAEGDDPTLDEDEDEREDDEADGPSGAVVHAPVEIAEVDLPIRAPVSFAEDAEGEILILDFGGPVWRLVPG